MKRIPLLIISLCAVAILPLSAGAATFKTGETVTVQDRFEDDLYAAGESITVKGDIAGDLIGVAGLVLVDGTVEQDALVVGGTLTLGSVGDDLRVAGGTITLNGNVGDDAFVAGGTIHLTSGSIIEGGLSLAGGNVLLDGLIRGQTNIGAGVVQLNGELAGPVHIQADRIVINGRLAGDVELAARSIELVDGAEIAGQVRYWQSAGELQPQDGVVQEGAALTFDDSLTPVRASEGYRIGPLIGYVVFSLLASALVLLVFVLLDRGQRIENAARYLGEHYWKSLLAGLIFAIVTPVVGIILMVTVIGIPLGLFVLVAYAFIMYALPILAALVFARWIDLRRTKPFKKWVLYFVALGLLVVIRGVAFIPFVGMLLVLFIVPPAFGSLLMSRKGRIAKKS